MSHDLKLERLLDASPAVVFGDFTGLQAKGTRRRPVNPPARVPGGRLAAVHGLPLDDDDAGRLQRRHGHGGHLPEHDGRTRMMIGRGGFLAAGVRDEFAGAWASILGGPGRAVAARVTDRS